MVKKTKVKRTKKPSRIKKFFRAIGRKLSFLSFIAKPFRPFGRYLKGAWVELKLVRWPDRRSTWALTLAVIIFSGLLLGLIVLLDTAFKALFEYIIT